MVGALQSPQALDLPLRRAGPYRVGAPDDAVMAQPLNQGTHYGRRQHRLGDHVPGEDRTQVAIDVADTVLLGDLGEVGEPRKPPGLLPFVDAVARRSAEMAVTRMVDDEVELRP